MEATWNFLPFSTTTLHQNTIHMEQSIGEAHVLNITRTATATVSESESVSILHVQLHGVVVNLFSSISLTSNSTHI